MPDIIATLFEASERDYRFTHALPGDACIAAALRALLVVVEPVVVEATAEDGTLFHLVAGEPTGRTYVIVPDRTVSVPRIEAAQLVAWFAALPVAAVTISILEGWFLVDAAPGAVLGLRQHRGVHEIEIVDHHGESSVLGPTKLLLEAPLAIELRPPSGALAIGILWSAWTDDDGIGRARFQRMRAALADAGWAPDAQ